MIGLSPSAPGVVQLTLAEREAASADTPVGAAGATAPCGVTAFDCADSGPPPFGLSAWTVKRYVVPVVRPVIVVFVTGGVPVMVFGVCAVVPTYGVILYEVTGPPDDGAVQLTLADVVPPASALTPETAPGAAAGAKTTSTQ